MSLLTVLTITIVAGTTTMVVGLVSKYYAWSQPKKTPCQQVG